MNSRSRQRIHPLVAAASVSVILVSMLGVAMITGIGPDFGSATARVPEAMQPATPVAPETVARAKPVARVPLTAADVLAPGETLVPMDPVRPAAPESVPPAAATDAPAVAAVPAPDSPVVPVPPEALRSSPPGPGSTHEKAPGLGTGTHPRLAVLSRRHAGDPQRYRPVAPSESGASGAPARGSEATGGFVAPGYGEGRTVQAPGTGSSVTEPSAVPRITPVYRPQPQDYAGMSAATERGPAQTPRAYRGAPGPAPDPAAASPDPVEAAPAVRVGSTAGRSLGDQIDRTVSAILGVLGGGADPARPDRSQAPQPGGENVIER